MIPQTIFPDLQAASVLITGGGTGIGAALTEGFCRQNARVAFIDIAAEPSHALCQRLAEETGNRPVFIEADLTDLGALERAVAAVAARHGPVMVLVNNAARDDRHRIEDVTGAFWDANHAVNLRPHFFAVQAVVGAMKAARRGSIINFSSISYMINGPDYPVYAAAKAGVVGLTKGLAGALGPYGIRVNAIAPGWVLTERQRRLWVTEKGLREHIDRQCLKSEIEPDDMVGPCLFLASETSRMLTAQTLIVDGGVL